MLLLAADVGGYDSGGRGPYDDFWYGPIPGKTTSGVRVDDNTAMRLAVLYACVNLIAQDLAKVPLVMYRRKDDGGRVRVTNHPVVDLLRKPTRNLTAIEWKERLQGHQLLRGNGYCEMRTDWRGRVVELFPWKPDNVRVEVMPDESLRYHVRNPQGGTEKIYLDGEVLHLRGLSLDGPLGLSPIDMMKEALGEAVASQSYGATFFANDARPNIVLEHPTHFQNDGMREEWLKAFKRAFGGSNRFSTMLTEYGIKVNQLPLVSHADLQFIELRKFKNNEICAIFRVPPHKVAILERSTNNNIEHQGIEYVTDCLLTWCRRWEERLSEALLADDEREEYYFEFLLDALMRGDTKSRYDAYTSAVVGAGWLTRNEVRRRENLDDLPDLDEPLQPLNMVPAGSPPVLPGSGGAVTPPAESAPPADLGAPDDDSQKDARAKQFELQARRRALIRETRAVEKEWQRAAGNAGAFAEGVTSFYAGHLDFVAEALVIPRAAAEAYCLAQCAEIQGAVAAGAVPALLVRWTSAAATLDFANEIPRKG